MDRTMKSYYNCPKCNEKLNLTEHHFPAESRYSGLLESVVLECIGCSLSGKGINEYQAYIDLYSHKTKNNID